MEDVDCARRMGTGDWMFVLMIQFEHTAASTAAAYLGRCKLQRDGDGRLVGVRQHVPARRRAEAQRHHFERERVPAQHSSLSNSTTGETKNFRRAKQDVAVAKGLEDDRAEAEAAERRSIPALSLPKETGQRQRAEARAGSRKAAVTGKLEWHRPLLDEALVYKLLWVWCGGLLLPLRSSLHSRLPLPLRIPLPRFCRKPPRAPAPAEGPTAPARPDDHMSAPAPERSRPDQAAAGRMCGGGSASGCRHPHGAAPVLHFSRRRQCISDLNSGSSPTTAAAQQSRQGVGIESERAGLLAIIQRDSQCGS